MHTMNTLNSLQVVSIMAHTVSGFSNDQVLAEIRKCVFAEKESLAAFLDLLIEVDQRQLFLLDSCPSLFRWIQVRFNMDEGSAYKRIAVARKGREVPELIAHVRAGKIHLSGAARLSAHITRDNAAELLAAAAGRTQREIDSFLAQRFSAELPAAKRDSFQFIAKSESKSPLNPVPMFDKKIEATSSPASPSTGTSGPDAALPPTPVPAPDQFPPVKPCVRIGVTLDAAAWETLDRLMRIHPGVGMGDLVSRGLQLLQQKTDPELKAARIDKRVAVKGTTAKQVAVTKSPPSRSIPTTLRKAIPAAIKREVYRRDGGQCTYVGADECRCPEKNRLEYDHVKPVTLGGKDTATNLRMRCKGHNRLAAAEIFGADFMSQWSGADSARTRHVASSTKNDARKGKSEY